MGRPDALCPLRFGEACTLCVPGATGPQDCQTVALVMADPEMRAELARLRKAWAAESARRQH